MEKKKKLFFFFKKKKKKNNLEFHLVNCAILFLFYTSNFKIFHIY